MPTFYPSLPDNLREWILAQPVFFTATAPTFGSHINVSPKGYTSASLAFLSNNSCAYLDATGSGCETAAHLRDNGRITLMWLSFGASPRILRLFGTGRVIERGSATGPSGSAAFEDAVARMRSASGGALAALPVQKGTGDAAVKSWRAVVEVHFFKVQTSCGFGVPLMTALSKANGAMGGAITNTETKADTKASAVAAEEAAAQAAETARAEVQSSPTSLADIRKEVAQSAAEETKEIAAGSSVYKGAAAFETRATLANFMATMGAKGGREYQAQNNASSLDGLPGYTSARRTRVMHGSIKDRARNGAGFVLLKGRVAARTLWGERFGVVLGLLLGVILGLIVGLVLALGRENAGDLLGQWALEGEKVLRERTVETLWRT